MITELNSTKEVNVRRAYHRLERSQILMTRSWPTVKMRFFSSSTSMSTIECLASKNVASEGRSVSFNVLWHVLQTRTSYSKPMIGMLIRFGEQLSQIAFPQFLYDERNIRINLHDVTFSSYNIYLQWCWRFTPRAFRSNIAFRFQKKGFAQS
jgi:hypothetical protein